LVLNKHFNPTEDFVAFTTTRSLEGLYIVVL